MIKKSKIKELLSEPSFLFCLICTLGFCAVIAIFILTHGQVIDNYFFHDGRDTGMDFFHSIEYVRDLTPYSEWGTLYPPLANLFFYIIYLFVPYSVSSTWAETFSLSVQARGTNADLRTYQAPLLMYLVFVIICTMIITNLVRSIIKDEKEERVKWIIFSILTGYGLIYCVERGNLLYLTICLMVFFVFFRDSENKFIKELSLISLAIAAGFKIYPAFFGILLIKDGNIKDIIRTIIYGVASFILPFFAFKEKLGGLSIFLKKLFAYGSPSLTPWAQSSFAGILSRISLYTERIFGFTLNSSYFTIAGYCMTIILLIAAIFLRKKWMSYLSITIAIMIYSAQADYIYILYMIPVLGFLSEEKKITKANLIPFVGMTLLYANIPLFFKRGVSYKNVAARQLIVLILICYCLASVVSSIINYFKTKKAF